MGDSFDAPGSGIADLYHRAVVNGQEVFVRKDHERPTRNSSCGPLTRTMKC